MYHKISSINILEPCIHMTKSQYKRKNLSAMRLQLKPGNQKEQQLYKFIMIFILFFSIALFIVFSWGLTQYPRAKPQSIFLEEFDPTTTIWGVAKAEETIATPHWIKAMKEVTKNLFTKIPPSQNTLNKMLKDIYQEHLQYPTAPDLANLQARLFWYKIHLASSETPPDKIDKWKAMASHLSQTALDEYRKTPQSFLQIHLEDWMPEVQYNHYRNITVLAYSGQFKACDDLEYLCNFVFSK